MGRAAQRRTRTVSSTRNNQQPFFQASGNGSAAVTETRIQRSEETESAQEPATPQVEPDPQATALPAPTTNETTNYLGQLIGGLVEGQLGDAGLRRHINTLAGVLQGLALDATDDVLNDPDRLAALGVNRAFRNAASGIIGDPGLSAVRQTLIQTITDHDEVALVTALAGGIAAYLMDVDIEASPEFDLGQGATLGTSFDLGSVQNIEFNRLQVFSQFATEYFQARSTIGLRRELPEPDVETGEISGEESFIGTASGRIRFGNSDYNLTGSYTFDTTGAAIFSGILNAGQDFGNNNRIAFTTDVTHNVQEGETTVSPGIEGRLNLGGNQQLRIGAEAEVSSNDGLEGMSGYIEYSRSQAQLRLEGNMNGISQNSSIAPNIEGLDASSLVMPVYLQLTFRSHF